MNMSMRAKLFFAISVVYFLIVCQLHFQNYGGTGFQLPQNIISLIFEVSVIVIFLVSKKKSETLPKGLLLVTIGVAILALPLLYTASIYFIDAAKRILFLLFGIIFIAAVYNLMGQDKKKYTYYVLAIMLAGSMLNTLCTILSLTSAAKYLGIIHYPLSRDFRVQGTFQQVNVYATYIVYTMVLSCSFLYRYGLLLNKITKALIVLHGFILFVLLVQTQSRTGYLSFLICLMLSLVVLYRKKSYVKIALYCSGYLTLSIVLFALCFYFLHENVQSGEGLHAVRSYSTYGSSTLVRLQIYKICLTMIMQHPFIGWGYGSFEYAFQHFIIDHASLVLHSTAIKHPHNEILLWAVEGGAVSLLGLLVAGTVIIQSALRLSFKEGRLRSFRSIGSFILILPILLHSLVEFPLYESFHLWIVLMMVSSVILIDVTDKDYITLPAQLLLPRLFLCVAFVLIIVALVYGGIVNIKLNYCESHHFEKFSSVDDFSRYDYIVNDERINFDEHVYDLNKFNFDKDNLHIINYKKWANDYLNVHFDPNVYKSLMLIARLENDNQTLISLHNQLNGIYRR